jgi:endonuclease YncB( thermonuclease family)
MDKKVNNGLVYEDIFDIDPKKIKKCRYSGLITYARVYKVYDGDTISIIFKYKDEWIKYNCRLNHIDSPEMTSNNIQEKIKAKEAQQFLSDLILEKIIIVHILDFEKFGRLISNLYNPEDNSCINDLMIEKGYAVPYDGGKRQIWDF